MSLGLNVRTCLFAWKIIKGFPWFQFTKISGNYTFDIQIKYALNFARKHDSPPRFLCHDYINCRI